MSEWRDSSKVLVQVTYERYDDGMIYEMRDYLENWLNENDAGCWGAEIGFSQIADEFYGGDYRSAFNFHVVKVEYIDEKRQ